MVRICVIGTGYVGLVVSICLAQWGHEVIGCDQNKEKIQQLQKGILPIYEPGLAERLQENIQKGSLNFTDQIIKGIHMASTIFICVGTPSLTDGSADVRDVMEVAQLIGNHMYEHKVVVIKSTVPIGTTESVRQVILQELERRCSLHMMTYMVSNPEFLREGSAVRDFMNPERVIIGIDHAHSLQVMQDIYRPLIEQGFPLIQMDIASAEMTKYAANAMLACRISFMNEIASLCERCGADIEHIRQGIALDPRIGPSFLHAGIGYGGSCFPKDVRALLYTSQKRGVHTPLLESIEKVNQAQKKKLALKVMQYYGSELEQITLAVWGLAFKPDTDDLRESSALDTIYQLAQTGASLRLHDPVAIDNARQLLKNLEILYVDNPREALKEADGLLLLTDWGMYHSISLEEIRFTMRKPILFDGRQFWNPEEVRKHGMIYHGIGRNTR